MCSLAGFFYWPFSSISFILHLIFTCRSCCFPLEQSRSHSTPVRNAIRFEFYCLAQQFIKVPDIPCLECKTPEESSTYISKNVTTNLVTAVCMQMSARPLDCGRKKQKKKSRRVYFMVLMCVVPSVTGTFTRHMKFAPKCWWHRASGASWQGPPSQPRPRGGEHVTTPEGVFVSTQRSTWHTRMHNLQIVTSNQLQMPIQACADVKENIRPLTFVHV